MIKTDWNIHDLNMLTGHICMTQFLLAKKPGPNKYGGLTLVAPRLDDMKEALRKIDNEMSRLSSVRCSLKAQIQNIERAEIHAMKAKEEPKTTPLDF